MIAKTKYATSRHVLFPAMVRRIGHMSAANGEITFPAVPSMVEAYATKLEELFAALSRPVEEDQKKHLRSALAKTIDEAFPESAHAKIVVTYKTDDLPAVNLTYEIHRAARSFEDEYGEWVKTREPPLFGKCPDAKVTDLACSLEERSRTDAVTCLDVGAGTGRNTVPLARSGFPIDALEPAPALAEILEAQVSQEKLPVRVARGNILDSSLKLPRERYRFVFLSEVVASHFRTNAEVKALFHRMTSLVEPGGVLLFNVFLAKPGYSPDRIASELSEHCWSTIYTRQALEEAMRGEPFVLVADEGAADYEHAHLPEDAWPPTGWYEEWSGGRDVFNLPLEEIPMELRWLTYERVASPRSPEAG